MTCRLRAEGEAEEAVDRARWAAEEARDDVRDQTRTIAHERDMRFLAAAEAERRAIALAAEAFRIGWEASGYKDRMQLHLAMVLSFEPSIEDLGWTATVPMPGLGEV